MSGPMAFRWDGEAMTPATPYWRKVADRDFVVGQTYALEEIQERSSATHAHYFACVADAWASLPEGLAERYPTPESLRKKALIATGFRDETTVVCGSRTEALRMAGLVPTLDNFAVVVVRGVVVTILRAKSQKHRAMDRKTFQASKEAVLEYIGGLIGVSGDELAKQGQAA